MDELSKRLYSLPDWGYVIYRTTYSSESNASSQGAVRYIEACIKRQFLEECTLLLREDVNQIWANHRSTIMEDPKQFDGRLSRLFALISRHGWKAKASVTNAPDLECASSMRNPYQR
jgi:hypothetical protein